MEIPFPRRGRLTAPLLVLLGLGAAFAFYFFHYLNQRSEYLRGRNLRELATLARQIEDAVATWDEVAWTYVRSLPSRTTPMPQADDGPDTDAETEGGATTEIGQRSPSTLEELGLVADHERFGEEGWYRIGSGVLAGGLLYWPGTTETTPGAPKEGSGDPDEDSDKVTPPEPVRETVVSRGIGVHFQGRAHWLSFEFNGTEPIAIHLRLSQVLGNLSLPENFFDHLLLLDKSGKIIYRRTGPDLKLARLDLEAGEPLPARSHRDLMEIAGRTFELFTQPVMARSGHLRPGDLGAASIWTLAGLVSAKRLDQESGAASPLVMLVVLCVFLLLVLFVPVIKMWALAPHERLLRRDLIGLAIASTFAVALITLLATDLWTYHSLSRAVDKSLEDLSTEIETHLVEEIGKLQTLLRAFMVDQQTNHLKQWSEGDYRWAHAAFWIDPTGMQQKKWTIGERPPAKVSVAERTYYQQAAAKRLWYLGDNLDGFVLEPVHSFTTGSQATVLAMPDPDKPGAVYAIATELLSVTHPVLPPDVGFAIVDEKGIAVFHSDSSRNGLEDFLAACDESPWLQAALHTPGGLSKSFHDTDSSDKFLNIPYQGRPHRVLVRQIDKLPLWLVVFHARSSLHRMHLDLMLWVLAAISLLLLLLAGLAFLLGALSLAVGGGPDHRDWLVGIGERYEGADLKLAAMLALLGGTLLWALLRSDLLAKLILAATVPFITLLFFLARAVWKRSGRRRRWLEVVPLALWFLVLAAGLGISLNFDSAWFHLGLLVPVLLLAAATTLWLRRSSGEATAARWHWVAAGGGVVTNTLMFFVVVAALPTSLLFQVAEQVEWRSLVLRGQLYLAEQLETRDARIRESFSAQWPENLLKDRLDLAKGVYLDRYESTFFCTEVYDADRCPDYAAFSSDSEVIGKDLECVKNATNTPPLDPGQAGFKQDENGDFGQVLWDTFSSLRERLPLRRHRALDDAASNISGGRLWDWDWDRAPDGYFLLEATRPDRSEAEHPLRCLHTLGTPPAGPPSWSSVVVFLGGALILGIIGVRARRLLTFSSEVGVKTAELSDVGDHLLWTTTTDNPRRFFPEGDGTIWLNLARTEDRERIRRRDRKSLTNASRVVFESLELLADDPRGRLELLEFGQTLACEQECSLLFLSRMHLDATELAVSVIGPNETTPSAVGGEATEGNQAVELMPEQLLALVSCFTVYQVATLGPEVELPETVKVKREADPRHRRLAWLVEEAGTNPRLRRSAAWLARNPQLGSLSRSQLEEAFEEANAFYYQWLWRRSSAPEKLLLFQLAQEGLVNSRARVATLRLLRRGLVVLTAERGLHLLNRSFRRWVLKAGSKEGIQRLEQQPGGWQDLRNPVYLALAAILLFLLTTQQDLFSGALGKVQQTFVQLVTVLTALVGSLAGLTKVLGYGR